MSLLVSKGGINIALNTLEKKNLIKEALDRIGIKSGKALLIPPDFTRFNSNAGEITAILYNMLSPRIEVDILPALGTHTPMSGHEIKTMFGNSIPLNRFKVHDWKNGLMHLGDIPEKLINEWSEGKLNYSVRIEINKTLFKGYDLILSIGQIVPHEVAGMANYTKNICVGVGGQDIINKSHFLGAVYGMERIMGRIDTPVRRLLNYAVEKFMSNLPIFYIFTVMEKNRSRMEMRGLYIGNDLETFKAGAELSQKVNLNLLETPLKKAVVYLNPEEFKSAWLGNKAIYRTRMAMADNGELIVLAPGLKEFGEDAEIDRLIRKYGYRGTSATLSAVQKNEELKNNLSTAAHLIHGSSEGRFNITYCPGHKLSLKEIRGVGFNAESFDKMSKRYDYKKLKDGFNEMPDGESIFFISNPGLGLWALKEQFKDR